MTLERRIAAAVLAAGLGSAALGSQHGCGHGATGTSGPARASRTRTVVGGTLAT